MATLLAVLRSAGAIGSSRVRVADTIRAFKRAAAEEILRRRNEAVLQAFDRRVLIDLGIERREQEEPKPEECRAESISLRAVFSWTRFAK
jgi:hypothetical protein